MIEIVSFKTPFSSQTERFPNPVLLLTSSPLLKCLQQSKQSHRWWAKLIVTELRGPSSWRVGWQCETWASERFSALKKSWKCRENSKDTARLNGCCILTVYPCVFLFVETEKNIYESRAFQQFLNKSFCPATQGLLCPTAPTSLGLDWGWLKINPFSKVCGNYIIFLCLNWGSGVVFWAFNKVSLSSQGSA